MEIENVNSKANTGVTLGGVALGTSLLSILGGHLFGFGNGNNFLNQNQNYVTRTEFQMSQELAKKDSEIALIKSEQNTEVKIADVYARLKGDMLTMERNQSAWNSQQMVNNATMSAAIAQNANSIEALKNVCSGITKTVVPITAVCPQPMPQYNSWTEPTA